MSKKIKALLVKKGMCYIPATDEDLQILRRVKEDEFISAVIGDERELLRHRRFFMLLSKVLKHVPIELEERYPTTDSLLFELKMQLQMFDIHVTLGGTTAYRVHSINFATMGETKFIEFVNNCKAIILKRFLTNIDEETFDREFLKIILMNG